MNATAIAQHLNVIEEAILEVQEWARVLWVRVSGLGCRFVSKKVVKMSNVSVEVPLNLEDARAFGDVRFQTWNEEIRQLIVRMVESGREIEMMAHPKQDNFAIELEKLVTDESGYDGRSFAAVCKIAAKLGANIRNY